jgi:CheY-like chemotaxis protein
MTNPAKPTEIKPDPIAGAPSPATVITPEASGPPEKKPEVAPPEPTVAYALVIDDEPANRDFLMRLLQQAKFEVQGASMGSKAVEIATELGSKIKLVMLDHQLPDQSGVELLAILRPHMPDAKIVMATMHDEPGMMRKAFEAGCNAFLVKPHGFMELFKLVQGVATDPTCVEKVEGLIFDLHGPRRYRPPT